MNTGFLTITIERWKLAMVKNPIILLLNLPSPPGQMLWRDTAGGFGTSLSCPRNYKTNGETPLHPFLPYSASVLLKAGNEFKILDCQRLKLDNEQALECIKKTNPSIVFSIISLPSCYNGRNFIPDTRSSQIKRATGSTSQTNFLTFIPLL